MDSEITILILDIGLAFAIALIAYRRAKVPGAISLIIFSASLAVWSCSFLVFASLLKFLDRSNLHVSDLFEQCYRRFRLIYFLSLLY